MINSCPFFSWMGLPSLRKPVRISGPCNDQRSTAASNNNNNKKKRSDGKGTRTLVSSMTAQGMPVISMAALRLCSVSWWYSWQPWEKLKRATFMPALRSRSIISTDLEAGPSVHTIFVFGRRTAAMPHSHTKARTRLESAKS
ncbi:hypothetical protein MUK42_04001 [Musa troglodytarum]|uniref:Uncharacterized protein n=1 Tax=Musa troglodytarum TaxID=320322 RepID=A0A9E7KJ68_9LILI|nr:hypothetical protein MUK42_04001 [Musa troglodytarum]